MEKLADSIIKASDFFYKCALKVAHIGQGVHADTLVISCSWMAGTMLFRSFALPLDPAKVAPGSPVLSDQANQSGPQLMNTLFVTLRQLGHNISEQTVMASPGADALSTKIAGFTLLEAQKKLDPFYLAYCKTTPLSYREAAFASTVAAATGIHQARQVLDPQKAAVLAIHALVEGCKTQPIPFADKPA
jgi:hypothetical protein